MTIHLIDGSGNPPASLKDEIMSNMQAGDTVIFFDTEPYGAIRLNSQQEIDDLKWLGGGGSDISTAIALVEKRYPTDKVICYSDGYFWDGEGLNSVSIKTSNLFKDGRFELRLMRNG